MFTQYLLLETLRDQLNHWVESNPQCVLYSVRLLNQYIDNEEEDFAVFFAKSSSEQLSLIELVQQLIRNEYNRQNSLIRKDCYFMLSNLYMVDSLIEKLDLMGFAGLLLSRVPCEIVRIVKNKYKSTERRRHPLRGES